MSAFAFEVALVFEVAFGFELVVVAGTPHADDAAATKSQETERRTTIGDATWRRHAGFLFAQKIAHFAVVCPVLEVHVIAGAAAAALALDPVKSHILRRLTSPESAASGAVCFATPAARADFARDLASAVADLVACYHDASAPGARPHRLRDHPHRALGRSLRRGSGTVEHVHQDGTQRYVLLWPDRPSPGIALIGTYAKNRSANGSLCRYAYGDDARDRIAHCEPAWRAWLTTSFGAV